MDASSKLKILIDKYVIFQFTTNFNATDLKQIIKALRVQNGVEYAQSQMH